MLKYGNKYDSLTKEQLQEWNNLPLSEKQPFLDQVNTDKSNLNKYCQTSASNDNQILLLNKAHSLLLDLLSGNAEAYLGESLSDADKTYYTELNGYAIFESNCYTNF